MTFLAFLCAVSLTNQDPAELARWEQQAAQVTIVRDDWGIPHIFGKTDAAVVFGMLYAQAEDDFNRVETNYLNAMGRLAEAQGESAVMQDLRMKLFIHPDTLRALYASSPEWLQQLMSAFADGLNFYLYKHPEVKPRVIARFEPWMALSFSEGSIGGDIERVNLRQLEAFYTRTATSGTGGNRDEELEALEPGGSNGLAIAPSNTKAGRALLLINPHTSFFFREELHAVSEAGLNAYGAVTWGQFFVYQGFNDRIGWMHTSSGVDAIDEYLETVVKKGDQYYYRYGGEERPVTTSEIVVPFKTPGGMSQKTFTVYRTHHGPIVRQLDDRWVSVRLMQSPVQALTQSYTRTKARNYGEFRGTMDLHTNSSNNTIYADADGNIAYFHANFIPRRDRRFDWTKPVEGSSVTTEWGRLLAVEESPHLLNPQSGWLYNANNAPWSAAGAFSPKKDSFPAYVETGAETPRGRHAIRVLDNVKDFTPASLTTAAFDPYLPWFATTIPPLVRAWDSLPAAHPLKTRLAEPVAQLKAWDFRWSATSVPTTLAVFWGEEAERRFAADARRAGATVEELINGRSAGADQLVQALGVAVDQLISDFGSWKMPWGEINRFQRLTGDIVQPFDDAGPSIPVAFTASRWGSLAAFAARRYSNTKKWYGTAGNSFVAVVEFGDSVRARAVTAGGLNSRPQSPHFNDQARRYAAGDLREVYFYRPQLAGHTEREYHPGN
jgi:acyl-homoserine lactone acylase PvdQ